MVARSSRAVGLLTLDGENLRRSPGLKSGGSNYRPINGLKSGIRNFSEPVQPRAVNKDLIMSLDKAVGLS